MKRKWQKNSWRKFNVSQQPIWADTDKFEKVIDELNQLPSLVFSGESRNLITELSEVNKNNGFVLQVGNCAESFSDCSGPKIHNLLRTFLQMSFVINYNTGMDVIKIGRIAGQYAKPRSSNFETINGLKLPSYRGDIVNDFEPTIEARTPQPERLKEGYFRSAATLNLIRAFIQGGYSDIHNINDWEEHFFEKEIAKLPRYHKLIKDLTSSFEKISSNEHSNNRTDQIYASHEGLILDYEEAFTRLDTTSTGFYDTSAHFIWVGDRTRQFDSAHIEFLSGIGNPVGLKIGPQYELNEVIKVIRKLNSDNIEGKLVLIGRMGKNSIEEKLPPLIESVQKNNLEVIWICDPMHGNTFTHENFKVRSFDDIVYEIKCFFKICRNYNIIPGGIHLEITDENVTECIGGINGLTLSNLGDNYTTKVDPRLNAAQALEIAFIVSEFINNSN